MGPLVREHHGYIDKYVGDSIMALFDRTPDDAVQLRSACSKPYESLTKSACGRARANPHRGRGEHGDDDARHAR